MRRSPRSRSKKASSGRHNRKTSAPGKENGARYSSETPASSRRNEGPFVGTSIRIGDGGAGPWTDVSPGLAESGRSTRRYPRGARRLRRTLTYNTCRRAAPRLPYTPCPSALRSASTIIRTSSGNRTFGAQPSVSAALAAFPSSKSTSADRRNRGSVTTYSRQSSPT